MNRAGEENRSVRNTRRRLREALLRLLEQKPLHEISVKELTELADVNRGTFYFHYQDIFDLLVSMEDAFFEQLDRTLSENPVHGGGVYPYLHAIFSFLGENRDFCRIMLGPHGPGDGSAALRDVQRLHHQRLHRPAAGVALRPQRPHRGERHGARGHDHPRERRPLHRGEPRRLRGGERRMKNEK